MHRAKKGFFHSHGFKNIVILIVAFGVLVSAFFLLWLATLQMPDLNNFDQRKVAESTKIYDKTGTVLLYDVHQDMKRTVIPFEDISPFVKDASIAIEDSNFYSHKGVDLKAILRSVYVNLFSLHYEQGGSTITQQVIKNSVLSKEKSITRKIKEWILAIRLEKIMTKDQILGLYLNEAPYGGSIYGVEEASQSFFAKPAKDLTLAQAAYLAALPQAPSHFSPYGSNREALDARKNLVLRRMLELKFITQADYDTATKEKVVFQPQDTHGIKAPHFVFYVIGQLEDKYGQDAVEQGGLRVTTTLDYSLQQKAEEIVKKFAAENEKNFNAHNAGMVAIDPTNGQILVMVGSRDYFDRDHEGNFNIALAKRQPGSSFKPFVYATAFAKGLTPETVVFDAPTQFDTNCDAYGRPLSGDGTCYMPSNFDGAFRGPISLRNALAQSLNIPAIQVLYLAGIKDSLATAKNMGISTLGKPSQYGLTLVLGGGEVTLLDMTSGYSVFANQGVRNPEVSVLKVEDNQGETLEEFTPQPQQVLDSTVASQINSILSDNVARAPDFGDRSALYFEGRDVAAKTGTTNDYRDAWIIGYTPHIALGAWVGNNNNTPMVKKVAGFIVAPMWNAFMQDLLATVPNESFPTYTPNTDPSVKPILRGDWWDPAPHSILYWVDKNDISGPPPANPYTDPQYILWETAAQNWVAGHGARPTSAPEIITPPEVPTTATSTPLSTTQQQEPPSAGGLQLNP